VTVQSAADGREGAVVNVAGELLVNGGQATSIQVFGVFL